jgi:tRNA 2-thiouridine synthesizing protein B
MLREGDDLLLIQDGVLAAIEGSRFVEILTNAPISVSALKEDIDARGLAGQISAKIDVVGYTDFVNLAVTHSSQMNW